ncbi:MAG: murein L,D-transpeptidase catalytic domain family protein [Bacteroidota bacterium]|nr:murein L,D-transpeptidase catalytic domain family protein [Bacteroidota bacterium]
MNKSLKKFHVFLGSAFIFLIHLPFVFAKMKPYPAMPSSSPVITKNAALFNGSEIVSPVKKVSVYDSLKLQTLGLSKMAYETALKGFNALCEAGKIANDNIVSIVDFSLPSSQKRLFVIDLKNFKLLFNTYVAHGRNSGKEFADQFSNDPESFKSSLGFYITKDTYNGAHGFSLHLEGEEKGINDNAYSRSIVMHSAAYVDENIVKSQGFIGRSLGCPALSPKIYKPIIEKIKNGSCLFLYSPNTNYLLHSRLLNQTS